MAEIDEGPNGIQVIARAATILRILADHPAGLSLSAIATQVGLARSTVQRIVQALQNEGMVELSGPQGGFQLGPALARLVYRRQADIVNAARPLLEMLCSEIGETVALCGLAGDHVTTVDRCISEQVLRVVFPLGTIPHPAHKLAPGLAILSGLPELQAAQILTRSARPEELHSVQAELAKARDTGRSTDTATFIPELSGFAMPLITDFGVHSIAVILPTARALGQQDRIFSAIYSCRTAIQRKLER